jgi:hypothetical protein
MSAANSVTANFAQLFTQTIAASPAGPALTVDGASCPAPCSVVWAAGTSHTIAVAATQSLGSGAQLAFSAWSDGGAVSHTVTAPSAATTCTATFVTQYYLTTGATTGGFVLPASGYFTAGSTVSVAAYVNTNQPYNFTNFSGALSGSASPQTSPSTGRSR